MFDILINYLSIYLSIYLSFLKDQEISELPAQVARLQVVMI